MSLATFEDPQGLFEATEVSTLAPGDGGSPCGLCGSSVPCALCRGGRALGNVAGGVELGTVAWGAGIGALAGLFFGSPLRNAAIGAVGGAVVSIVT